MQADKCKRFSPQTSVLYMEKKRWPAFEGIQEQKLPKSAEYGKVGLEEQGGL
ncbi:hypothetical protein HSIEG1_3874 [Enterococcus sp. HSIEG1]|nr:hypothetical protein HSIEG1_3874 [Enterococcus sp. HSIEG1]